MKFTWMTDFKLSYLNIKNNLIGLTYEMKLRPINVISSGTNFI